MNATFNQVAVKLSQLKYIGGIEMTVADYAKLKGISKQAVYEKLRRNTLSYELIDGIKHIVETLDTTVASVASPVSSKKFNKTLKKLNKAKHKLEIAVNEIQALHNLLHSKDSEIDTLKKTFGLMTVAIENKLLNAPGEEIIVKAKKEKKRK